MQNTKKNRSTWNIIKSIIVGLSLTVTGTLAILVITLAIMLMTGNFYPIIETLFVEQPYERWVSQFDLVGVQAEDTVFLGDSLTEYGAWNELFPESTVANRGIVGDTTTGVLARLDQVIEGQPSQIFLMIGTNDIFAGRSEEEIVGNIVTIVDRIQEASPETEIYVQSLLPREAVFQDAVESLNASLEIAIEGKATWVNLYPLFLGDDGASLADSLTNDELHLMGEGYIIWRDAIAHLVNQES